mmetsp:Transcript_1029/g.1771  ORF Transcript_1029/g.1771 Transcript_1029/m.1771 type:complete len:446 (+) Transcript_1029:29-1366(+)
MAPNGRVVIDLVSPSPVRPIFSRRSRNEPPKSPVVINLLDDDDDERPPSNSSSSSSTPTVANSSSLSPPFRMAIPLPIKKTSSITARKRRSKEMKSSTDTEAESGKRQKRASNEGNRHTSSSSSSSRTTRKYDGYYFLPFSNVENSHTSSSIPKLPIHTERGLDRKKNGKRTKAIDYEKLVAVCRDNNMRNMLAKMQLQAKRRELVEKAEKEAEGRDPVEKAAAVSKALCEYLVDEKLKEKLLKECEVLEKRIDSGLLSSEDDLKTIERQLLTENDESWSQQYDEFLRIGSIKAHRERYWKIFESEAKAKFWALRMKILGKEYKDALEVSRSHDKRLIKSQNTLNIEKASSISRMDLLKGLKKRSEQLKKQCEELEKQRDAKIKAVQQAKAANDEDDDNECQICCDQSKDTALSCGHMLCNGCASRQSKCPWCSKEIKFIVLIKK